MASSWGLYLWESIFSVTCSREITIVHWKLGLILMALRIFTAVYIVSEFVNNYSYLDNVPVQQGTSFSGDITLSPNFFFGQDENRNLQTYVDAYTGETANVNLVKPHYCYPPYTNGNSSWPSLVPTLEDMLDQYNTRSQAGSLKLGPTDYGCLNRPFAELVHDNPPWILGVTTAFRMQRIIKVPLSANHSLCNATMTLDANHMHTYGGFAACREPARHYYTINPESLGLRLKFQTVLRDGAGTQWSAQSATPKHSILDGATQKLGLTLIFKNLDGSNYKVVRAAGKHGKTITSGLIQGFGFQSSNTMNFSDFMNMAGATLDDLVYPDQEVVNRLTGLPLRVSVEIINYNAESLHGVKMQTNFWRQHDPVAVIYVEREHVWAITNVNPDYIDYRPKEIIPPNVYYGDGAGKQAKATATSHISYDKEVMREYGIRLRFVYTGTWGFFSLSFFLNTLVQGLILLGVSVQIVKVLATYCFTFDGTSQIFSKYVNTPVVCSKAVARTAVLAAMQSASFFSAMDPEHTMEMNKGRLFQNLRLMMGTTTDENGKPQGFGLTDAQLAAVVSDVVRAANDVIRHEDVGAEHRDPVALDEFCELTADDNCDVLTLVGLYKDSKGDQEALESLLAEDCIKAGEADKMNMLYGKKCRQQQQHDSQILDVYQFDRMKLEQEIEWRQRFAHQAYGKNQTDSTAEVEVELHNNRVIRGSEDSKPPSTLVRIETIDL